MNRPSTLATRIAVAMLLMVSGAAVPQTAANRYTVEIVVYRNDGQTGALPSGSQAEANADADDGVEMTAAPVRKLGEPARKLRATAGFKVLAHTAWTQPPTACVGSACRNSVRGVSAAQLGIARAGISGKVGLQRGTNGLYLGVDLTVDDGGRRFHIQESRVIKADQPQYFDHPAIGVLAVVTAAAP